MYDAYCIVVIHAYHNVVLSLIHLATNMHYTQHAYTHMYVIMPFTKYVRTCICCIEDFSKRKLDFPLKKLYGLYFNSIVLAPGIEISMD